MTRIEHLLREIIGLDGATMGPAAIQRAVRQRMRSLGLKRSEDYTQRLEGSREEFSELVESLVVTETWFFRDAAAIGAFVRLVLDQWLPAHPVTPLRVLSLPCASGEEPYSLVMTLRDAGVPSERFQVEAADISAHALARAQRGVYRKNAFRGTDLGFLDRYFRPSREGFVLDPAIRKSVRFLQANLFSETFLPGNGIYDFIFCRNLLIYFDRPTQGRALARLEGLLAPSGVLFVGPAEQSVVLEHGFVSLNVPKAFACRVAGPPARRPRSPRVPNRLPILPKLLPEFDSPPKLPSKEEPSSPAADRILPPLTDDLETARGFANAGRLKEAAQICEARLRRSRTSAQAYYLLGLVRDASGDASAMDCYRKALYLEPNHYESLLQMALLLERNGNPSRARVFKNRALRLKPRD